jgi:hypothetical protein
VLEITKLLLQNCCVGNYEGQGVSCFRESKDIVLHTIKNGTKTNYQAPINYPRNCCTNNSNFEIDTSECDILDPSRLRK